MKRKVYRSTNIGLFGHPIDENPTVVLQEAGFRELGLNYRYLNFDIKKGELKDALKATEILGFRGLNLTIPHKVDVIPFLDNISDAARKIGAVNTVVIEDGKLFGENTDGKGFIKSVITDAKYDPRGADVVILGAGGAARAIAVELILSGVGRLTIVNRTEERGRELVELLERNCGFQAEFKLWKGTYEPPGCDVLINSTSINLFPDTSKPDINYDAITPKMIVCDVIPNPPQTEFLVEAERRGAKTLDGLGMLVYQGAIGFKLWTGFDAPVDTMRDALLKEFS